MAEILSSNIKTLREHLKDRQAEFADRLDVSQGTVARWESGAKPKPDAIARLADLAGCSASQFLRELWRPQPGLTPNDNTSIGNVVLFPVALPNADELTAMFAGLLAPLREERDQRVIARRLAQQLPNALAQTLGRTIMPAPGKASSDTPSADAAPRDPASRGS